MDIQNSHEAAQVSFCSAMVSLCGVYGRFSIRAGCSQVSVDDDLKIATLKRVRKTFFAIRGRCRRPHC